jgi:hypothetical protein
MTPKIQTMASGNLSLRLNDNVTWGAFPERATAFLSRVQGERLGRADSPVERVWTVRIQKQKFWLSCDDYSGLSLESQTAECNSIIEDLRLALSADT